MSDTEIEEINARVNVFKQKLLDELDAAHNEFIQNLRELQILAATPDLEKACQIINAVCAEYDIERRFIESASQVSIMCDARHTAIGIIRMKVPGLTLKQIGKLFGNRDHSTVAASIDKHKAMCETDEAYRRKTHNITHILTKHGGII